MLKSMSTEYVNIPLIPKGWTYCSLVQLKKASQTDGSTALVGLGKVPVLGPVPSALGSPFLRTKMHPPRSCVASLEWENLGKTKTENLPVKRGVIM